MVLQEERAVEKYTRLPKKALTCWRIRLALIASLPALLSALFYSYSRLVWGILTGLWMAAFLLFYFGYYPLKRRRLSYGADGRLFLLNTGVVYDRRKAIPLERIQYVTVSRTPLQRAMGLASVYIHMAGGMAVISCVTAQEAVRLRLMLDPLSGRR